MKKKLPVILSYLLLLSGFHVAGQTPWYLGGNMLPATSRFGSNNGFAVIFETNDTARGTITASGRWGIGTTVPENTLHVVKGSAGTVTAYVNSSIIAENSNHNYISILAPSNRNRGILFGDNLDPSDGGIAYLGASNSMEFKTNGNITRMALSNSGNLGIGTALPFARLHIGGGTDADISGGGHIILGSLTGFNIALDDNEIMARNNGATSELALNAQGGNVDLSAHSLFVQGANKYVGIGTVNPAVKLQVSGGTSATLASGGYILSGLPTQSNIAIDATSINARTNSVADTLSLNRLGGLVRTGGSLDVEGPNVNFGTIEYFSDGGNNIIKTNSSFYPIGSCSQNLGSSDFRWNEIWACDGTINTSDIRAKKNVRNLEYGIKEIMKLRPVKFNWLENPDQSDRLGVIAQEIRQVLPEVVRDYEYKQNEKTGAIEKVDAGVIGVNYAEIIPVLIRSIQQQQQMIEEQNKKIEELQELIARATAVIKTTNTDNVKLVPGKTIDARLEQNVPNPFNKTTTIRYKIPPGSNAQIAVYDQTGKLMKTLEASGSGVSQINANTLSPGTYTYTLSVNGKLVESKKMMIVK